METMGVDIATHLANPAIMTETVEMAGMIFIEMTDVTGMTTEKIDVIIEGMTGVTMAEITDVTGVVVTVSGLGDNKVQIFTPA